MGNKEPDMKFKIISMLITLTILSVVPMIYMGKFDPLVYFQSATDLSQLKKVDIKPLTDLKKSVTDDRVQVYKWRDENGVMQFSNSPPPTQIDQAHVEQVELHTNSNLMQAVKVPSKEEEPQQSEPVVNAPSPYSVKGMKKVMDDARGVEELLQKRHEQQQEMLNNI
jgi:hypothetical protein